jgi:hypothetical protein
LKSSTWTFDFDGTKLMAQTGRGSTRDAVRWGLLLAAVAVSGYRLPATFRNFQEWRAALPVDPSAADLYKTNFSVNAMGIVIILAVAVGVFYLLRPRVVRPS